MSRKTATFYAVHSEASSSSDEAEAAAATAAATAESRLRGRSFDPVTFDVLRVDAEQLAGQLSLVDLRLFKAIAPDELTSCSWHKRDKLTTAPNVVALTRRFNHVCFWTQRELLQRDLAKARADALAHFVRIARRLVDLRNLHSAFAIVSGLQSLAIYRLSQTWSLLAAKERSVFDKLCKLFSEDRNFERLRRFIDSAKLPCIPYLGLYLTDLVYIDLAHPTSGGMESGQRRLQMNNILRVLADFQQSNYDNVPLIECIQTYFDSVRHIDELEKFVEDENYKKSLQLEADATNREAVRRRDSAPVVARLTGSRRGPLPLSLKAYSLTPQATLFRPAHRKTHSLGSTGGSFRYTNGSFAAGDGETAQTLVECRHLLDDSIFDFSSCTVSSESSVLTRQLHDDSGHETSDDRRGGRPLLRADDDDDAPDLAAATDCAQHEGPLRRRTLLRNGRRPTVLTWSRYWVRLWETNLIYYPQRPLPLRSGLLRDAYKAKPSKIISVSGWMVIAGDAATEPNCFQLQEPSRGMAYKFDAGSESRARIWVRHLKVAADKHKQKLPTNLLSFDE